MSDLTINMLNEYKARASKRCPICGVTNIVKSKDFEVYESDGVIDAERKVMCHNSFCGLVWVEVFRLVSIYEEK